MSSPPSNAVQIRYNGTVFEAEVKTDQLTARTPCPLVSISTESNKDIDNNILYDRSTITLEGIILSSGKTDFLTSAYTGVISFFNDKNKQNSLFEIVCGTRNNGVFSSATNGFIQFSGTSFVSANADKSNDNWFLTIPYTVVLESVSKKDSSVIIESYEDSWTIEPLEDISYYNIYANNIQVYDISTSASYLTPGQPTSAVGQIRHNTPPSAQLVAPANNPLAGSIEGHLQYRITHRVSAVGRPTKIFNPANPNQGGTANTPNNNITAYENAALWVNERVARAVNSNANTSRPTGVILSAKTPQPGGFNLKATGPNTMGLFLYNHVRSIESSPSAGSYGVTDSWLALGTGVKYTEEFTWEVSVDDRWIHTVSMNGTIKGLELVSQSTNATDGTAQGYTMMPTGAATGVITGRDGTYTSTGQISLIASKFGNQNRRTSKYESALEAYISGVKPYLYARASHALTTSRTGPPNYPTTDTDANQNYPYGQYKRTWFGPAARPLNIVPVTINETFNPIAGTIGYSISYDNRPACLLSGALNASVSITDNNSTDLVAEAFILGRPLGPVIEKVGTTKSERQLSIEAVYPQPTGFQSLHPQSPECVVYHTKDQFSMEYKAIMNLVDAFKPVGAKVFGTFGSAPPYSLSLQGQVFKTSDSETWSPFEGRYTRNVTWIYNTGTCT
jgi:hypothetical protein